MRRDRGDSVEDNQETDRVAWIPWVLLVAMAAVFLTTAWQARFVMDEFALLQGAGYLARSPLYRGVDPIKTVLATELYSLATWAVSSVGAVRAGRVIGMLAAVATFLLIYKAARELWPRRSLAVLVVIAALSFSNVFERAFRIRTDTIALPFALAAFVLLILPRRGSWHTVLAGTLLGASFLCTQKAIYFIGAFLIALVLAKGSTEDWRQALRDGALLLGGWCAAFLAYAIYFGGTEWWRVVTMVLVGPQYIFSGTASYSGLSSFITQSLGRNIVPYALTLTGLGITLACWRQSGFAERFAAIATMLVVALIFTHSQPWPYVFVWPQALLALWVLPLVEMVSARGWLSRRYSVLAVLILFAAFALPRQTRYLQHTNFEQLSVIAEAERLLEPGSRYFDGVGMVVKREIAGVYPMWCWDVPNLSRILAALRARDDSIPRAILADHPKLWILNYRIVSVAGLVNQMMEGGYVRVSPLIMLSGAEMGAGATEANFACHWPGRYQFFDLQGQVVPEPIAIDGASPATVVEITKGVHRLERKDATQRRFLLPVGSILTGPLAPEGPVLDLYSEVYTF